MSIGIETFLLKHENVLHGDDISFSSDDFRDLGNLTGSIDQPVLLNDQLNGGGDLFPDSADGKFISGHQNHVFQTAQRVTRTVRVNCRQ